MQLGRKCESTALKDRDYQAELWALFECSYEGCTSLDDIDILTRDVLESCRLTLQGYNNQFTNSTDCSDDYGFFVVTDIDGIAERNDERQAVESCH